MREIRYSGSRIERVCTDERFMVREYGSATAKVLRRRIAELRSAETMADVLDGPGRWEALTADRRGCWSARVSANWRLLVRADGPDSDVVLVEGLEDYH